MRDGNFRKRLPVTGEGLVAELTIAYNEIAERQQHILSELSRVQRVAGREGRHSERLQPGLGEGGWARCVEAANSLVTDLVRPTGEFARVVAAVSDGDLTQRMDLRLDGQSLRGEPLRVARSVNGLVDQLSVDRRRDHPGHPRGRHRGQARRPGAGPGRGRRAGATSSTRSTRCRRG